MLFPRCFQERHPLTSREEQRTQVTVLAVTHPSQRPLGDLHTRASLSGVGRRMPTLNRHADVVGDHGSLAICVGEVCQWFREWLLESASELSPSRAAPERCLATPAS